MSGEASRINGKLGGRRPGVKLPTTLAREAAYAERLAEVGLQAKHVLNELALHGFSNVKGLFDKAGKLKPMNKLSAKQAKMIASFDVLITPAGQPDQLKRVRMVDKAKALELLAKHFQLLNEPPQTPQVVVLVGQGSVAIGPNPWASGAVNHNAPYQTLDQTTTTPSGSSHSLETAPAPGPPTPERVDVGDRIRTGTQPGSRPERPAQFSAGGLNLGLSQPQPVSSAPMLAKPKRNKKFGSHVCVYEGGLCRVCEGE